MNFTAKKTENCFADSQTWEYALPVRGEIFSALLPKNWSQRINAKLRRPVFIAERGRLTIKGMRDGQIVKVSFPEANWEEEKNAFEAWLKNTQAPNTGQN